MFTILIETLNSAASLRVAPAGAVRARATTFTVVPTVSVVRRKRLARNQESAAQNLRISGTLSERPSVHSAGQIRSKELRKKKFRNPARRADARPVLACVTQGRRAARGRRQTPSARRPIGRGPAKPGRLSPSDYWPNSMPLTLIVLLNQPDGAGSGRKSVGANPCQFTKFSGVLLL